VRRRLPVEEPLTRPTARARPWTVTAISPDNGNGDGQFGMDHLGHAGDYDALAATYLAAAARIR
jgi:hypothetical protein